MPGTLKELAAIQNRRWQRWRERAAQSTAPSDEESNSGQQIVSPERQAPAETGSQWKALSPLPGRPGGQSKDPMSDFNFLEAVPLPMAIIICFAWRPDPERVTYLLVVPFRDDRVDLDGGSTEIREHIAFRVLDDSAWKQKLVKVADFVQLVAPMPAAGRPPVPGRLR